MLKRTRPPYLYEFYNVFGYCQNSSSLVRGITIFYNPLTEALNAQSKLPHYVIFILDQNFIEHIDPLSEGNPDLYPELLEWLVATCEKAVRRCRTELFDKKNLEH